MKLKETPLQLNRTPVRWVSMMLLRRPWQERLRKPVEASPSPLQKGRGLGRVAPRLVPTAVLSV